MCVRATCVHAWVRVQVCLPRFDFCGRNSPRVAESLVVKFPSWTKLATSCKKTLHNGPGRGNWSAPAPIATLVKALCFGCKITWLTPSRVKNRIRQRKTTQRGWTIHASSIHLHTSRMEEKVPICCFISKLHLSPNSALPMQMQCFWKSMAWPRTPLSLCLSRSKCNVAFFPQR